MILGVGYIHVELNNFSLLFKVYGMSCSSHIMIDFENSHM